MNCAHVLGLIDAGPFADYPRAHLDAARRHARSCATCGPALLAATTLTADLSALPQPAPPPDLAGAVLARIAQIDLPVRVSAAAATPETVAPFTAPGWSPWATALGGLSAGLAIVLSMPSGYEVLMDIASPRIGAVTTGLVGMPSMTAWAVVLAAGLVLYVTGLFAPVGKSR